MKVEVNITKKYLAVIIAFVALAATVVGVIASHPINPGVSHDINSISGIPTCTTGQVLTHDGTGIVCAPPFQKIRWDKWIEFTPPNPGGPGSTVSIIRCQNGWIQTAGGHRTTYSANDLPIVRCTRVDSSAGYDNPAAVCKNFATGVTGNCIVDSQSASPYGA